MIADCLKGLSLSGFAPSFVDFKHMVKTTMTFIGLMPIFQAIGCVCGSLCKSINNQGMKNFPRGKCEDGFCVLRLDSTFFHPIPFNIYAWQ